MLSKQQLVSGELKIEEDQDTQRLEPHPTGEHLFQGGDIETIQRMFPCFLNLVKTSRDYSQKEVPRNFFYSRELGL